LFLEQTEQDFQFWPCEKWNENQKMKEGGGEGKEGRKHLQTNPTILKTMLASEWGT